MSSTNFIPYITPINADWLNDIDASTYQGQLDDGTTNASLDKYLPAGVGAIATTVQDQFRQIRYATNYDTLANFFAGASNNSNYLPPGTYTLTSLLSLASLTNCTFWGVPGQTKITGAFGYALMQLAAMNGVYFYGITFESTYTNAAISANTAVVYQGANDCVNVTFKKCKFTSPNANTQGLALFNRTSAGGSDTCVIDGLWIDESEFSSIGQTACTIYNRQTSADKYTACRNIHFTKNRIKDIGLNSSYGIGISLDGYGSSFWIDENYFDNCYLIGIENTKFINGSISRNKFANDTRGYAPIRVADSNATYPVTGVSVVGNVCLGTHKRYSYSSFGNKCYYAGNIWNYSNSLALNVNGTAAFSFLDSNDNTVNGDIYISDTGYSVRFQNTTGTTSGNRLSDAQFDNSAAATNIATVNFDGAGTTDNIVEGKLSKGTGGSAWTQTTSAVSNSYGKNASGTWTPDITFATPGDLAKTLTVTGVYQRVGRLCTATFQIDSSAFTHTTAAGAFRITGLPFAAATSPDATGILGAFRGITKASYTQFNLRTVNAQTYLQIYASGSGQVPANLVATDMPSGGTTALYGQITYVVQD